MAHYLIEFRFHGYAKWYAKNLIYDVARKFNVRGVTQKKAVPHISLFGPFQTNDERRLVSEIISVGNRYDLVPFRIKGFDFFNNQNKVIYLDIRPSEELKCLRRDLAYKLLKFSNSKAIDNNHDFTFHATVAFKDIDYKFDRIWNYIQEKQEPEIHQHLLRITIIKNSKILYEYDLMQKRLMNRRQALSKLYWNKTIELLKHKTPDFHQDIDVNQKHESFWDKIKSILKFN
ncbi:MAG: 2'-5' RNA ligase family protein [Candidatus Methanoperedens sp.]